MTSWRQPPVGQVPHASAPEDETPPRGMVRVMGARLAPSRPPLTTGVVLPPLPTHPTTLAPLGRAPSGVVQRTLPGMPAPPHAIPYMPVPAFSDEDEITETASPAYRDRRLMADWRSLPEDARKRVERYIQALHRAEAKKK